MSEHLSTQQIKQHFSSTEADLKRKLKNATAKEEEQEWQTRNALRKCIFKGQKPWLLIRARKLHLRQCRSESAARSTQLTALWESDNGLMALAGTISKVLDLRNFLWDVFEQVDRNSDVGKADEQLF